MKKQSFFLQAWIYHLHSPRCVRIPNMLRSIFLQSPQHQTLFLYIKPWSPKLRFGDPQLYALYSDLHNICLMNTDFCVIFNTIQLQFSLQFPGDFRKTHNSHVIMLHRTKLLKIAIKRKPVILMTRMQ